eukprot:Sro161_g072440.2  (133) ;mRNA; f:34759-35157
MARVVGVVDVPIIAENVNVQISRSCRDGWFGVWTGADMRRDGQLIAFNLEGAPGSGGSVYFFPRASNQSVREALSGQPCNFVATLAIGLEDERKYEAVAFVDPAGIRLAHVSECSGVCTPSVFEYDLEYIPS